MLAGIGRALGSAWMMRRRQTGFGSGADFAYANGHDSEQFRKVMLPYLYAPRIGATVVPLANYVVGSFVSDTLDVPDAATSFIATITRNTPAFSTVWPNTSALLAHAIEISLDTGVSWLQIAGCTSGGGPVNRINGQPAISTIVTVALSSGTGRLLRLNNIISGATAFLGISIAFTSPGA